MDHNFEQLVSLFIKFPGIGARQARRLTYYLLAQPASFVHDFVTKVSDLRAHSKECSRCYRFFLTDHSHGLCSICSDSTRDQSILLVVEKDIDLENIRKTDTFPGLYFVLGGIIPILADQPDQLIRIKELEERLTREASQIKEVVLALSATPEGENTIDYLKRALSAFATKGIKLSVLGRGLSSGTELEYSDKTTLQNALANRQ